MDNKKEYKVIIQKRGTVKDNISLYLDEDEKITIGEQNFTIKELSSINIVVAEDYNAKDMDWSKLVTIPKQDY